MDISWWGGGDGHQMARADYDVVMLPEGAAILWRISLIPPVLVAHPAGACGSSHGHCWLILLVRIIGIMLIFRWGINPLSDTPPWHESPASPASSRHRLVAFPAYSFTTTSSTPCPAVNLSRRCASSYVHPSMNRPPTYISLGFLSR